MKTNEKHFFTGALWATIGIAVVMILAQLPRNMPELVRLTVILVIVAWIFFWFGSEKTANFVYHIVNKHLNRR